MKKRKTLTVFFMASGILMTIIMILCIIPSNSLESVETVPLMVTDFHMKKVVGAALINEKGSVALMVQDGEIEILDAPPEMVFSAFDRKAFLYQMAHLKAEKSFCSVNDWSQYGLGESEEKSELVLFLMDGSRIRLFLGDRAPIQDMYYLRKEGDDSLFLIGALPARMMMYSLNDFREENVLPDLSADCFADIRELTMHHGEEMWKIQGENKNGKVQFFLTEPVEVDLSWRTVTEKLFAPLAGIEKLEFVSDNYEEIFSQYREDEIYEIILNVKNEPRRLLFADKKESDVHAYYCANPESGQVILVGGEQVEKVLQCSPMEFLGESLYSASVADMEMVTVIAEEFRGEMLIRGQGDTLRSTCSQTELGQEETIRFFETLTMLPPAEPIEFGRKLDEERLLTLYFTRRNGTEDVVEVIPVSERRCAVVINGKASFTTYTSTVEEIIRTADIVF